MYGFYRIAVAVPKVKVADVAYNAAEIIRCAKLADKEGAAVVLSPELCITGYTCGDLFHQPLLIESALNSALEIAKAFKDSNLLLAVGLPVRFRTKLYNCAALIRGGRIISLTPKTFIPNRREFYEKRHFSSGIDIMNNEFFELPGNELPPIPFTNRISCGNEIEIGVEICEDLWSPMPPSQELAVQGANLILNLSASNALVSKSIYRRNLVTQQSARCMAVYAYSSAGVHESTTDTVYGGHAMIAENGALLSENQRFQRESEIIYADADIARVNALRISEGAFQDFDLSETETLVETDLLDGVKSLKYRRVSPLPFVPGTAEDRDEVCSEIFHIQCAALAKRLESAGIKKAVIGISGGLDSTLALLVTAETFQMLGLEFSDILALTMPGFGTTSRTKNNSVALSELLGVTLREVDIKKVCEQQFKDLGHDKNNFDVTYENVQARQRTQVLMNIANRENGLVIGTGDLSEIALGWSTYNGDHMSMYAVNCGVPKTLVRHLVSWYAEKSGGKLGKVLKDIVDTPVSPELLPVGKDGAIQQETESIIGAYELHDFYLYHFIKYGAEPEKIRYLTKYTFGKKYPVAEIDRTLKIFFKRFFTQQFKRSCIPDGPKVGSIALSPRADWRMPSDVSFNLWLSNL